MLALQPEREFHLLQLARHGALLGQEQVFRELLRQRRAALRDAAMQHVGDRGARDADRVDAVMRIEAAVLDGDEGLRQIGRQILQRRHWRRPFRRAAPARCRRGRRSGWSAAVSGFPATGSPADARRPRSRRRPRRSRPTGRAPRPNRTAGRGRSARATFERRLAPLLARARLALARRLVVVVSSSVLRLADFFGLVVGWRGRGPCGDEAQIGERGGEPELRLLAPAALFPSPRHTQTPLTPVPAAR